jgi:hypothetical protein
MHDAERVRRPDRGDHTDGDLGQIGEREPPLAREPLAERLPLQEFRHDGRGPVLQIEHVEDPHHARVAHRRRHPPLAEEPSARVRIVGRVLDELERPALVGDEVLGDPDDAHAPFAQKALEAVACTDQGSRC